MWRFFHPRDGWGLFSSGLPLRDRNYENILTILEYDKVGDNLCGLEKFISRDKSAARTASLCYN